MEDKVEFELRRMAMEYDIAKTSTTSGVNARMIFLGFLISVNLAYFKEFYELLRSTEWTWCILLSLFSLVLNILIVLIYIREHIAQEENHAQVWRIRERYNILLGNNKKTHPDWFIFDEKNKGFFKGLTYKSISSILSLFISLIFLSILVTALKMNGLMIVGSFIGVVLVFLLVILFLLIAWGIYSAGMLGIANGKNQ